MGKFETLCGMLPADVNWGDPITPEIIEEIVLAERETCAEICDKHAENMARHGDAELAEQSRQDAVAIRARSNPEFSGLRLLLAKLRWNEQFGLTARK